MPFHLQENHLKTADDELSKSIGIIIAWVTLSGHLAFLLAIQYTRSDTDFYDNTILRSLSVATCLLLACSSYWQANFKWLVPWSQQSFMLSNSVTTVYFSMYNMHHQNTSTLAWAISIILTLATCTVFLTHLKDFLLHILLVTVITHGLFFWVEGHYFQYSYSEDPESRFILYLVAIGLPLIGGCWWVSRLKINYRSKLLRGLAASIAHEMRNPLAQLHGSLQMIEQKLSEIGQAKSVVSFNHAYGVIDQALHQIDIILDSIMDKPINYQNFSLLSAQTLIAEAIAEYAYENIDQAKSISMTGADFNLVAEPVMFKHVIFNLLQNALWFSKTLPNGRIDITLKTAVDKNLIEVRDNGPGIAADAIPKLFDNFYTYGKQGGTGLGLFYCKRAMLAFGGDITCESELGQYTAFTLAFPTAGRQQSKQSAHFESQQVQNFSTNGPLIWPLALSEKTVLIADDDHLNRTLMKGILHSWDIDCFEAGNGQEVLDILSNSRCDLILTDMQMPLMGGLELVQAIRNRERRLGDDSTPIIAVTAEGDNVIKTAMRLGANDHLAKPVTAEKVLPKLQQWLSDSDA